jgi:hypothetical protein
MEVLGRAAHGVAISGPSKEVGRCGVLDGGLLSPGARYRVARRGRAAGRRNPQWRNARLRQRHLHDQATRTPIGDLPGFIQIHLLSQGGKVVGTLVPFEASIYGQPGKRTQLTISRPTPRSDADSLAGSCFRLSSRHIVRRRHPKLASGNRSRPTTLTGVSLPRSMNSSIHTPPFSSGSRRGNATTEELGDASPGSRP